MNLIKRVHWAAYLPFIGLLLITSFIYRGEVKSNPDYADAAAICAAIAVLLMGGLAISLNHWLDQRAEKRKNAYGSIHWIDPRKFQATPTSRRRR